MADIRKFTGFIAPDGSTHDTIGKATAHTRNLKVKEALQKQFGNVTPGTHGNSVSQDDRDNFVIYPEQLPEFLFTHRDAIAACFKQDVKLRESRKPKASAPAPAAS